MTEYREGMTRDELEALCKELLAALVPNASPIENLEIITKELMHLREDLRDERLDTLDAIRSEARDCGCSERILKRLDPKATL